MADIRLNKVSKQYRNGPLAVSSLDLHIEDEELLALVGPSGSGKTTILRLIAGLERPTSGTIVIGDRDVRGVPPSDRNVAMVFQDAALYPHMTARRNLTFKLKTKCDDRVDEISQLLNITGVLDRRPGELSGGERQRVALGKALLRKPKCLLLDEPLSHVDAPLRDQLRTEIKAIHRKFEITIIYVTHDQEEAMVMGDRIAVIDHGRLQQVGTPRELREVPAKEFVAKFIRSATADDSFTSGE